MCDSLEIWVLILMLVPNIWYPKIYDEGDQSKCLQPALCPDPVGLPLEALLPNEISFLRLIYDALTFYLRPSTLQMC